MAGRGYRCLLWTGMVLGAAVPGCDRTPEPPAPAATAPQESATTQKDARPTTQQLISGPYKRMSLPGMPLALRVPQSWKIDAIESLVFLEGPTPFGRAMIQLSQRQAVRAEQIEMLLTGARKEQQSQPQMVRRAELRDVGNLRVLERLVFSRPITTPKVDEKDLGVLDENGNLITVTTTPVRWTFTVFVPYESAFSRYELNFIDLTAEQYEADREFLENVMASLAYDGVESVLPP